ncbi:hypothetical protein D3C81_1160330 [compost metagenome]
MPGMMTSRRRGRGRRRRRRKPPRSQARSKAHESLRRPLCGAGRHHLQQRQAGSAGRLPARRAARGRRLGGLLPVRRQAAPAGAGGDAARAGPAGRRAARMAVRGKLSGRGRSGRDHRAVAPGRAARGHGRAGRMGGAAPAAAARPAARGAARAAGRALAAPRRARAAGAVQADHGRVPRGRVAAAGHAGAGRGGRARRQARGRAHGRLHGHLAPPRCRPLPSADRAGRCRHGGGRGRPRQHPARRPALSLLPRPSAAGPGGGLRHRARRPGALAGGMEVGWHPRPAGAPGRRHMAVVARRGTDHRALSRAGRSRRHAAGRHRARRRDRDLAGPPRAAVRLAPAAHRPQDARCQAAARGTGHPDGLRPARMAGRGLARPPAG